MFVNKKNIKIAAAVALSLSSYSASAQVSWPVITKQTKPWARWWWEGSAVNKKDLTWNMESYRAAGLGGLEITPIYGVKGHENEFITYLSPQWVSMLQHTLAEGKRLDLGIDLANATGWPFGGPWVSTEDASKELFWKTYEVKGGEKLSESVSFTQQPLIRADGVAPKITDLVEPISSNKNMQLMALDQVRFEKKLPLTILMAYDGKGQHINLTNKVGADGKLDWTAPAGDWKLCALFLGWHGKMVERAAPGGEGYVIDHFSRPALDHYLGQFDKAFKGKDVSGIRGFFNDSYEVDDARGQSNFTPQFFDEFMKRRGYDLRDHLDALLGKADKETSNRVICDYRETISDLLLDNFTKPWHQWAKSKGAIIRNQSHGSPANILDLYGAIDIPETEGNDVLSYKPATSAAHVMGKPLASSESATWLNDHFLSSLGDVKQAIDKLFIGGVNHIFYHGVSYSPKDAPWPGWLFYAAVHFNQTNPFWGDFSTLNNYIARVQSFLQQGKPNNDVLVYYPLFDSFSDLGRGDLLKHYAGMRPDFMGTGFETASAEMLQKGYTFDFISDRQILNVQSAGTKLMTGGNSYKTILLPNAKYIPVDVFAKIMSLAKAGATVVVYKNLPSTVPGYGKLDERGSALMGLLAQLQFSNTNNGVKEAKVGKGRFLLSDEVTPLMAVAGIGREEMTDSGLQFVRRTYKTGNSYFISNKTDKVVDGWVPLSVDAKSVVIFNPMTKRSGIAKIKQDKHTSVYLQLQPGESCVLQTSPTVITGAPYIYYQTAGDAVTITGDWTLKFMNGGPSIPADIKTGELKSWTELGGDDAKAFSGTGSYTITFNKPAGTTGTWQLDLGKAHEEAEVFLNGAKLATLIGPRYTLNISAAQLKAVNKLEVRVANLMANRIIDMDKKNIPYRIFYNTNFPSHGRDSRGADGLFTAINWSPKPSGLMGPVTLTPLAVKKP
ncbi:glycoside hydrolase family 2 protein [Mucilaginibacter mali]|uniref:Glycoside hydrolase family 2 protein n=1 Tax=Mucilaginibacter mali TaxID=2740462 RepID=A0A7D4PTP0_9SPHI|nr:glycosyl hydrolase [Mucilaginibacter mali]QKJ30188.1 glycoside hydrolase family 2 protein [Mucilaginibacter mali]